MSASTTYLDHNASAPLLPEAREAIVAALELTGNPSSVHGHGRALRRMRLPASNFLNFRRRFL